MKKLSFITVLILLSLINVSAQQNSTLPASKVDFDAFEKLTTEVKIYRKDRLLNLDDFLKFSKEENTIILDTRSTEMFNRKHIKGAVHLDFTDFTQQNLAKIIPSTATRILIYCNNNFDDDQINFASKMYIPKKITTKTLTLALNIPTFINLYGYGYKNVYELADLVSVYNDKIEFAGTDVMK
jgi:hypothetical protein